KVLGPIWTSKPETARRLKQRIASVFDYTKAAGFLIGDNPVNGVERGLPKQLELKKHHKAMPHTQVSAFIAKLRLNETNLAFEFLILTAARTSEVLGATWPEVDFESATWTVPAERMKAHKEHKVPLSSRAMEILRMAR